MISKNDPDYVFDEYKGCLIASHKNNVPQKSIENVIIVYDKLDFPDYGFYIGLDDSKGIGYREMNPVNIEDAKSYIDWLSEVTKKNVLKPDSSVSLPVKIKEVVSQILSDLTLKRQENKEMLSQTKSRKKMWRGM
ncbi:hypothetical protein AAW12_23735 [Sphingobacterium sp. Ag1]|uniref:hypothetical protein n=1 Tax=Sphingobacterium sp. Ag1 TaxID=1643451 RepID=UPI0006279434|nr:hypothetical protein [Sphingobacterium sp. Ag1]KKO89146.1 hypothetical protein AAW12_23735 [Sphingobacterium sp. Ag1]